LAPVLFDFHASEIKSFNIPSHIRRLNSRCRRRSDLHLGPYRSGESALGALWTGIFFEFHSLSEREGEEKNICLYRKCDRSSSVLCQWPNQ